MHAVEVVDLCKKYVNSKNVSVEALKHINITIEAGEFVAIVGPSGSGKSTLLHLLGGLEALSEGRIMVNERNIADMSDDELAEYRRKEIGFVFQKFNLISMLNVRENIILPLLLGKEKVDDTYIDELIHFLGLNKRISHMPGELSGGQQQRVSIGRALAAKPGIILADEPTGNLDQKTSEEIMEYLKNLRQTFHTTVIMITHDMDLAKKADRMIRIVDGTIQE